MAAEGGFLTVCYYKWDQSDLKHTAIDTTLCTHLILGFSEVADGVLSKGSTDGDTSYQAVASLKEKNPALKVMLSVGGGGNAHGFHSMVSDASNTDRFVASVVETLRRNDLDGIDIDWEFPNNIRNGKLYFTRLLQRLYSAFDQEAKLSGKQRLILSAAVAPQSMITNGSYNVPEIAKVVDFINLMTYDLHVFNWYFPFAGHNSPLFSRKKEVGYLATLNLKSSTKLWVSKGMPKSKIVVGVPTYGLSWRLYHKVWHGVSCPTLGKGRGGGYVTYPDVCQFLANGGKRVFDKQCKVPYAFNKKLWISYDDVESLELKAKWIRSENFGGIMTFSLNCDDHKGAHSENAVTFPLHRKIKEVFEMPSLD